MPGDLYCAHSDLMTAPSFGCLIAIEHTVSIAAQLSLQLLQVPRMRFTRKILLSIFSLHGLLPSLTTSKSAERFVERRARY